MKTVRLIKLDETDFFIIQKTFKKIYAISEDLIDFRSLIVFRQKHETTNGLIFSLLKHVMQVHIFF